MLAKDIMTANPVAVGPKQTIIDVIRCMTEHRVSGIPVIDADRKLVGIVTEGDLLRRAEISTATQRSGLLAFLLGSGRLAGDYVQSHTRAVADVMTDSVATIAPDTELSEIVALMERHHVRRLPVVQGGLCVGIVSRADIIAALGRTLKAANAGPTDDATIRTRILDGISKADWSHGTRIDVRVDKGVVELDGVVFDERERHALIVLASNVPGVTRCVDQITWIDPTTGISFSASGAV